MSITGFLNENKAYQSQQQQQYEQSTSKLKPESEQREPIVTNEPRQCGAAESTKQSSVRSREIPER